MITVNLTYRHRELLMRFVAMKLRDISQAKRIAGVLLDVPFIDAYTPQPVSFLEPDVTVMLDVLYDDAADELADSLPDEQRREFLELMKLVDDANSGAGGEL